VAAPSEEYAGALPYWQRLNRHRHEFPFEELGKIAKAVGRWLDAGGGGQALSDLEELRPAAERVSEYQEFQFNRGAATASNICSGIPGVVVEGKAQRRSRLIAGTLAQLTAASKALTPLTPES
jgi:hypothetical protein